MLNIHNAASSNSNEHHIQTILFKVWSAVLAGSLLKVPNLRPCLSSTQSYYTF